MILDICWVQELNNVRRASLSLDSAVPCLGKYHEAISTYKVRLMTFSRWVAPGLYSLSLVNLIKSEGILSNNSGEVLRPESHLPVVIYMHILKNDSQGKISYNQDKSKWVLGTKVINKNTYIALSI